MKCLCCGAELGTSKEVWVCLRCGAVMVPEGGRLREITPDEYPSVLANESACQRILEFVRARWLSDAPRAS